MLAPIDGEAGYPEYVAARAEVALPQDDFVPVGGPLPSPDGRSLGLHKKIVELKSLFDAGKAGFVSKVGTLIEPVKKLGIEQQTANIPLVYYLISTNNSIGNRDSHPAVPL